MYGNLTKARWRLALWESLAKVADTDKWILTLAGKRFSDLRIAPRFAFNQARIIGVDTDDAVVRHNSDFVRPVVKAKLSDVVYGWKPDRPIAVVNADYCGSGGSMETVRLVEAWCSNPACVDSYLALNVSVGREHGPFLNALQLLAEGYEDELRNVNRAIAALFYCLSEVFRRHHCITAGLDPFGTQAKQNKTMQRDSADEALAYIERNAYSMSQYKARHMWMDGAVIRNEFCVPPDYKHDISHLPDALKARRRTAATLAVQNR